MEKTLQAVRLASKPRHFMKKSKKEDTSMLTPFQPSQLIGLVTASPTGLVCFCWSFDPTDAWPGLAQGDSSHLDGAMVPQRLRVAHGDFQFASLAGMVPPDRLTTACSAKE